MLTREKIRKEIDKYAADEDKEILHWLLERYGMEMELRFVMRAHWQRYGKRSYEAYRIWKPTPEGYIIYHHMKGESQDETQEGEVSR